MDPFRLKLYEEGRSVVDERYLNQIATTISEEVRATKCDHIRFQDGLLVLTYERWERGIINTGERDILLRRLYT